MIRRILLLAAAAALVVGPAAHAHPRLALSRPNIVVIETDDQTMAEMAVMPKTRALIGDEGVTFDNSFVTFSLCCPSRATFLTGEYPHNHGVRDNKLPYGSYYKLDNSNTLAVWLQKRDYYTALVGKYLNRYGRRDPFEIPQGWTDWHGSVDPSTYRYYDYTLNENGTLHTYCETQRPSCYQTDVYRDKVVQIIKEHTGGAAPLFLWFTPVAPHWSPQREADDPPGFLTPVPAPRYKESLKNVALPRPPGFNETDVSDKPLRIRERPRFTPQTIAAIQENWQQRRETLLAVDDAVEAIVNALREKGQLDNTLLIFTSDNGYFHGEHRIPEGKTAVYEPSIRVPLLMRWTANASLPRGVHRSQLVANLDLAETITAAAGAQPELVEDGVSLFPFWRDGEREIGRDLLIDNQPGRAHFNAIRTPHWLYAEYRTGEKELYDLRRDPYELRSLQRNRHYRRIRGSLHVRLHRLVTCKGATCRFHPTAQFGVTCGARTMTLVARGRGVTSVGFLVNGSPIAQDLRAPFRTVTRLRRGPVRAQVGFRYDRTVTLDRRGCA